MRELAIGEEVRIRCVEDNKYGRGCTQCIFSDQRFACKPSINCNALHRSDKKNVHFELVED